MQPRPRPSSAVMQRVGPARAVRHHDQQNGSVSRQKVYEAALIAFHQSVVPRAHRVDCQLGPSPR